MAQNSVYPDKVGYGMSTDVTRDATHRAPENVSHDLAEKGVPGVKAVRPAP